MNGLKIIRKKCGYSSSELADILNITRQTISMWENNKLTIPQKRKEELSNFFKIDIKYFNELDNKKTEKLLNMYVYPYELNKYKFEPKQKATEFEKVPRQIPYELNNIYAEAMARKKKLIEMINQKCSLDDTHSNIEKAWKINRVCDILELSLNMTEIEKAPNEKMYYHLFIVDTLKELNDVILINDIDNEMTKKLKEKLDNYLNKNT